MEVTVDKFGRIVIPKELRDELGLSPGAALQIDRREQELVLRPLESAPELVEKEGLLIYIGVPAGDLAGAVTADRAARLRQLHERTWP